MTNAFLAAYANYNGRQLIGLIELSMPSTSGGSDTLYIATREVITPTGGAFSIQAWQKGVLAFGPVHAPGAFVTSEVVPTTFSFSLENRTFAYSTGATGSLDSVLRTHYTQAITVTARLWEASLGSFADAAQVFKGIIHAVELKRDAVLFSCKQRSDWNRNIIIQRVNKADHPNAEESAVGQAIPHRWGAIKGVPLTVPPFLNPYGTGSGTGLTHLFRDICHGVRGSARCVVVDVGRGAGSSKGQALVAGHKVKTVGIPATAPHGTSIGYAEEGKVSVWDAASGDIFKLTSGSGFYLPDEFDKVYAPVYPVAVQSYGGYTPGMPRAVLDPYALGYCRIDQTNKAVEYILPQLSNLGPAVAVGIVCCYRSTSPAAALKVGLFHTLGSMIITLTASTSIVMAFIENTALPIWDGTVGAPDKIPYDFPQTTLRVYFDTGSSGSADIFYVGAYVKHKAGRKVIAPYRVDHARVRIKKHPGDPWTVAWADITNAAVTQVTGDYFANLEGHADDGTFDTSGNFTGTADALIERAPDIAQHVIVGYAKEPAANIERGVGVHGSFVDGRDAMKTWRKGEMPFTLKVSDDTTIANTLRLLMRDSLGWVFLSHLDNKWKYVPWSINAPANFRITFGREDLGPPESFSISMSSLSDIETSVSLRYLSDDLTRGFLYETRCTRSGSLSGYEFLNQRDQSFVCVTGSNDKIDWWDGTTERAATIAAGSYNTQGAIGAVYDALQASVAQDWSVGCGGTVKAGKNDAFKFTDGAGAHTVTFSAGTKTMEERAAELELAMRAISSTYSVTYTRATGLFFISKTGIPTWALNTVAASAYAMLGIRPTTRLAIQNVGSDVAVEEERFVIGYPAGATFDIRWRTGTNGWGNTTLTNIKTAAPLLGYLPSDDSVGAYVYVGFCPKGEREAALELAATLYGERDPMEISSETIRSTETAREIRNRLIDLLSKPRVVIRFLTERAPDIERGNVIAFNADMDTYGRGYPEPSSDGSWVGKRFIVTEIEHSLGPQTCATKIVAVSLG